MKAFFNLERTFACLCLAVLLTVVVYAAIPVEQENIIFNNVVRLHILANSDKDSDQQLKLKVRDEIVKKTKILFANCKSIKEAEKVVNENINLLTETAEKTIAENGYSYPVTIVTGYEDYPIRYYSNFTFPSGKYYSLRIKIGKAEGKNWWCVLFPPLCVSSAVSSVDEDVKKLQKTGFTEEAIHVLREGDNGKYAVKFKIVETVKKLFK